MSSLLSVVIWCGENNWRTEEVCDWAGKVESYNPGKAGNQVYDSEIQT